MSIEDIRKRNDRGSLRPVWLVLGGLGIFFALWAIFAAVMVVGRVWG